MSGVTEIEKTRADSKGNFHLPRHIDTSNLTPLVTDARITAIHNEK